MLLGISLPGENLFIDAAREPNLVGPSNPWEECVKHPAEDESNKPEHHHFSDAGLDRVLYLNARITFELKRDRFSIKKRDCPTLLEQTGTDAESPISTEEYRKRKHEADSLTPVSPENQRQDAESGQ